MDLQILNVKSRKDVNGAQDNHDTLLTLIGQPLAVGTKQRALIFDSNYLYIRDYSTNKICHNVV